MKSKYDKVMDRHVAMGDVAELFALSLGMMAIMSGVPRSVLGSALHTLAETAKPDQSIVLHYIAKRVEETNATIESQKSPGTH